MNSLDFVETDCTDLACHVGTTFIVDIQVLQECNDLPDDLTGYTALMHVYDEDDSTIADITGVISDPESGEIHFELAATATALLTVGVYNHHINLTIGSTVYRIAHGKFEVTA
jgi:hypothetical protein